VSSDLSLRAKALAEALGTGMLVAAVVGSGIAAQQLSPGEVGLQLLENSTATALALVALILAFGPVSGAHLNPAVTLAERLSGRIATATTGAYVGAQLVGGCLGAVAANLMFEVPAVEWSTTDRATGAHAFAEVVATFGLLIVIRGVVASGRAAAPVAVAVAVAGWIGAAYWFTSSTSFANPAVTVARMLSDTFAGIAPASVPVFVAAQLAGVGLAVVVGRVLFPAPVEPVQTVQPVEPVEPVEPSMEEVLDARSRVPEPGPAPGAADGGEGPDRAVRRHVLD
jgi:glycerol uptake facilitator-like aquaporin